MSWRKLMGKFVCKSAGLNKESGMKAGRKWKRASCARVSLLFLVMAAIGDTGHCLCF